MKLKELQKKGETLREQGKEAEQQIEIAENNVRSARAQLQSAQSALDAAQETDEDGNPKGNVAYARAAVTAAQAMLDAAESDLRRAEGERDRINEQKEETISEIDAYTAAEEQNLEAIRQLQGMRHGDAVDAFIAGLVERMNAGQQSKGMLEESMGRGSTARHYTAGTALTKEEFLSGLFGPRTGGGFSSGGAASALGANASSGGAGGPSSAGATRPSVSQTSSGNQAAGNDPDPTGSRLDPAEASRRIRDYSDKYAESLTNDQRRAIYDYSQEEPNYYKNINGVHRGYIKNFDPGNQERSDRIHEALKAARTPYDTVVYRGCCMETLGNLAQCADSELKNAFFMEHGYMSTTMTPGAQFDRELILQVHVPAGSHAFNIRSISAAGNIEDELLIDRGQLFQIRQATHDRFGRRMLVVDLIN